MGDIGGNTRGVHDIEETELFKPDRNVQESAKSCILASICESSVDRAYLSHERIELEEESEGLANTTCR